ncbi:hypothetical protein ACFX13_030578 [Malus domestica]
MKTMQLQPKVKEVEKVEKPKVKFEKLSDFLNLEEKMTPNEEEGGGAREAEARVERLLGEGRLDKEERQ